MRVLRWNSCTITRWFFVWKNCIALPERMLAGKPAGMQKSRGSSCLGSPVRGSKNASPPGLSGANRLRSKIVAFDRPRSGRYVGH